MTPFQVIQSLTNKHYASGDKFKLLAPLPEHEIEAGLRYPRGVPFPPEIIGLLRLCRGFRIGHTEVHFAGDGASVAQIPAEISPASVCLFEDGFGNFWGVDIDPTNGAWGAVFYCCHDPQVIIVQSPDVATFLAELEHHLGDRQSGAVDHIHDIRPMQILREPIVTTAGELASRGDTPPSIAAELARFAPHAPTCDLRLATPGDGFAWGGAVQRVGQERIFVFG